MKRDRRSHNKRRSTAVPGGSYVYAEALIAMGMISRVARNPRDIDQVQVGQMAVLRFSAFNVRTTPEINGRVTRVSADTTTDQRTGQSYYTIRIAMTKEELERLGDLKLIPGMPVEAFVQAGDRTLLSYLTKPLRDQFMRAFREK